MLTLSFSLTFSTRLQLAMRWALLATFAVLWCQVSQAQDSDARAFYDMATGNTYVALYNSQIGAVSLETQNPILDFNSVITNTQLGTPSIANDRMLTWFNSSGTGLPTGYFGIGPVFVPGLDFITIPSANGTRSRVMLGNTDLGLAVLNYTIIGSGNPTQSVAITVIPEPAFLGLLLAFFAFALMRRCRCASGRNHDGNPAVLCLD